MSIKQIFALLLLLISSVGIYGSISLDLITKDNIGPGFMPFVYSFILLLCSLYIFFSDYSTKNKNKFQLNSMFEKPLFNSLFFYIMTIIFIVIAKFLGMIVSLCIFSTIVLLQQHTMKNKDIVIFEVVLMGFIYVVFCVLLKTPFERGILFT